MQPRIDVITVVIVAVCAGLLDATIEADRDCRQCKNSQCNPDANLCHDGCNDGYYEKITGICSSCPFDCISCVTYTNCTQCKEGSYGDECIGDCDSCKDSLCDEERCLDGCAPGSFATSPDFCRKCAPSCLTCKTYKECQTCNEGFYLDTNTSTCVSCPRFCSNCTSASDCGVCKDEWYGPACEQCKEGQRCTDDDDSGPGISAACPGPLRASSIGVAAFLLILWKFVQ